MKQRKIRKLQQRNRSYNNLVNGEMFANNISNKVLVFKIYKELLKLNSKNSNNTSKKTNFMKIEEIH